MAETAREQVRALVQSKPVLVQAPDFWEKDRCKQSVGRMIKSAGMGAIKIALGASIGAVI